MTYYAERKSIKEGSNPTTVSKYGSRVDMEYQYCLFRASAVKNEANNDVDAIEWGTVEGGMIERKVYVKEPEEVEEPEVVEEPEAE